MTMSTVSTLLQTHLERVFNERDVARRGQAIQELYSPDAVYYEQDSEYAGVQAITNAVNQLLGSLPPLTFSTVGPVQVNHDMGKLLWRGHLADGTTVVTGTDVVDVEGGRIRSIHVFVDPQP